jgi:hypothetical protein
MSIIWGRAVGQARLLWVLACRDCSETDT